MSEIEKLTAQIAELKAALELGLTTMERHDDWCGHYRHAPGDRIFHQFTAAAAAALSPKEDR
jgi:hypothetical protein